MIETKSITDELNNHDIQLKRYFNVTKAKIGILTNGIVYKFFTDLEEKNIMDNKPFLVANFLDLTDDKILELKKFMKSSYNPEQILTSAEILKYSNGIKNYLNRQLENPDDDFIKIIGKEIYDGRLTQNKIEEFKVIFKDTFKNFINDFIRKKFETALESSKQVSNESEEKIYIDSLRDLYNFEEKLVGILKKYLPEEK